MVENKKTMEKNFDEYLKNLQEEKQKYYQYEQEYQ